MAVATESITITCADCGATRETKLTPRSQPRTPAGWKHFREQYLCDKCWGKRYVLRAISMPVASPLDCDWDKLRKMLRTMWDPTRR